MHTSVWCALFRHTSAAALFFLSAASSASAEMNLLLVDWLSYLIALYGHCGKTAKSAPGT